MIKMENILIIVIIAIISNAAFGLGLRQKRQTNNEEVDMDNLDDRYGSDRPRGRPFRPNQNGGRQDWPFPNQSGQPNQQQWGGQTSDQQWGGSGSRPNQPWDNSNQQNPGGSNPGQQNPGQQTTQNPIGSTSQSPDLAACILRCPTTTEYNPVCGSNSVTYSNPGKLVCAQTCGVNVSLQRSFPCPTTTTAAPAPAS